MINQLLYFLVSCITISAVMLCFSNLTKERIKITPKLLIIIISGLIISAIFNYYQIVVVKTFFSLLYFYVVLKNMTSKSKLETFYYALIIWLLGMLLDVIIMLLLSIPVIYNILSNIDYLIAQTIGSIMMAILLYLISKIPLSKKAAIKIVAMALKIKPTFISDVIYISIIILINAACVFNLNKLSLHLYAIIIISLLLILIFSTIVKNYNIKNLKEINSVIVNNTDFLLNVINDYRILKHNLTGQLLGIKSVANKESKILIDDLIMKYNTNFLSTKDINKIPSGLNGIVYEKVYSFNKQEICLAVENTINSNILDVLKPRVYNSLCETLGVLIDNALEAAYDSEEKSILIDFTEEKDFLNIKIINTFNNVIDVDNLGQLHNSSKGKQRGIGLFSIFKRNEINVNTSIYNNLFESKIRIKKALIN